MGTGTAAMCARCCFRMGGMCRRRCCGRGGHGGTGSMPGRNCILRAWNIWQRKSGWGYGRRMRLFHRGDGGGGCGGEWCDIVRACLVGHKKRLERRWAGQARKEIAVRVHSSGALARNECNAFLMHLSSAVDASAWRVAWPRVSAGCSVMAGWLAPITSNQKHRLQKRMSKILGAFARTENRWSEQRGHCLNSHVISLFSGGTAFCILVSA